MDQVIYADNSVIQQEEKEILEELIKEKENEIEIEGLQKERERENDKNTGLENLKNEIEALRKIVENNRIELEFLKKESENNKIESLKNKIDAENFQTEVLKNSDPLKNKIDIENFQTEILKIKEDIEKFKGEVVTSVTSIYNRVINDSKEPIVLETYRGLKLVHIDSDHELKKILQGRATFEPKLKLWRLPLTFEPTFTDFVNKSDKYKLITKIT